MSFPGNLQTTVRNADAISLNGDSGIWSNTNGSLDVSSWNWLAIWNLL
jgi:hypothetical protein